MYSPQDVLCKVHQVARRVWKTENMSSRLASYKPTIGRLRLLSLREAVWPATRQQRGFDYTVQSLPSPMADLDILTESAECSPASYPFDLDSADIILRTSDRVDFRVHRAILAIASPVFASMFQRPQPQHSSSTPDTATSNPLPVIGLSEDSRTLDSLLRLCYPVESLGGEGIDDIIHILDVANKYNMQWPMSILHQKLGSLTSEKPLVAWAAACRTRSETAARTSAECLLQQQGEDPIDLQAIVLEQGIAALEGVSAGDYHRLDEFLRRREEGNSADSRSHMLSTVPTQDEAIKSEGTPDYFATHIPDPDVICRSADNVDFDAHRAILLLRSVTFEKPSVTIGAGLLERDTTGDGAAPRAEEGGNDELPCPRPILHFNGDAETLSTILAICYGDTPSSLFTLSKVIAACNHGSPGLDSVHGTANKLWDEQARSDPFLAYFIAVHRRLTVQAQAAAKQMLLQHPSESIRQKYVSPMEQVPAQAYHKLVAYLLSCESVVRGALDTAQEEWRKSSTFSSHKCKTFTRSTSQAWLLEYFENVKKDWMGTAAGGRGGWDSSLGPLPLVKQAIGYSSGNSASMCSRTCTIIQNVLDVGDTLLKKLVADIDKITLEL
ncbi:hypothetical protein C2E23DRAFT_142285 [Lenzites betulinus]|nr:hypothetical protein C2E23DRAFT_142285 [Lenzites betulinus]